MSSFWDGLRNTKEITEVPFYAVNLALPEDSFYTNREVARACVETFLSVMKKNKIDWSKHTFIEPSAGEGCFYDVIPPTSKKIGLDLHPAVLNEIQQGNFLTWYPSQKGNYIVIGNPPFGIRGAMALAFIKRAFLFADLVAFILPMSFYSNGKGSNMLRVENAELLHSEKLHKESFYRADTGARMSVNTVFQVWKKGKKNTVFVDYDVSEFMDIYTVCSSPARYCGLGRGRKYDCFVASTFYENNIATVDTFEEVHYGSGYGMIIKKNRREVEGVLRSADWTKYCSAATNRCKHIRMHSIRRCLGENGFGSKK